jgi:hypothetical protein
MASEVERLSEAIDAAHAAHQNACVIFVQLSRELNEARDDKQRKFSALMSLRQQLIAAERAERTAGR